MARENLPDLVKRLFQTAVDCRQPAAAVMHAACCGMDGNVVSKTTLRPRQQAGRPDSGSKLPAVHGETGRAEMLWNGRIWRQAAARGPCLLDFG